MYAFLEGPDLFIVLAIVLVIFGGTQLPKLARSLGEAHKELKKGMEETDEKPRAVTSITRGVDTHEADAPRREA